MGIIGTITGTGEIIQNAGGTTKHICRLRITALEKTYRATIIVPKTVQTVANLCSYIRNNSDYAYSSGNRYYKAAIVYYCGFSSDMSQVYQCLVSNEAGTSLFVRVGTTHDPCSDVTATFEDL